MAGLFCFVSAAGRVWRVRGFLCRGCDKSHAAFGSRGIRCRDCAHICDASEGEKVAGMLNQRVLAKIKA